MRHNITYFPQSHVPTKLDRVQLTFCIIDFVGSYYMWESNIWLQWLKLTLLIFVSYKPNISILYIYILINFTTSIFLDPLTFQLKIDTKCCVHPPYSRMCLYSPGLLPSSYLYALLCWWCHLSTHFHVLLCWFYCCWLCLSKPLPFCILPIILVIFIIQTLGRISTPPLMFSLSSLCLVSNRVWTLFPSCR